MNKHPIPGNPGIFFHFINMEKYLNMNLKFSFFFFNGWNWPVKHEIELP